ncbi:hypothetical protein BDZ91DRAFT_735701 [Kalaharituber pfeilii]|nr:hypothetical protein BDZ91DRAFT_735701 [Kalaharituber pfeilii]
MQLNIEDWQQAPAVHLTRKDLLRRLESSGVIHGINLSRSHIPYRLQRSLVQKVAIGSATQLPSSLA